MASSTSLNEANNNSLHEYDNKQDNETSLAEIMNKFNKTPNQLTKSQQQQQLGKQVFSNLSNLTKELSNKPAPLIIKKVNEKFRDKIAREKELIEKSIKSKDIEDCIYTQAGNILIYCKNLTIYNQIKQLNTLFNEKKEESKSVNDYKSIVIKDLNN